MGDMGDFFNALRAASIEKRSANLDASEQLLNEKGIPYKKCNPWHFLVAETVDFWPTTGRYIFRGTGRFGRGVRNLMRDLQK